MQLATYQEVVHPYRLVPTEHRHQFERGAILAYEEAVRHSKEVPQMEWTKIFHEDAYNLVDSLYEWITISYHQMIEDAEVFDKPLKEFDDEIWEAVDEMMSNEITYLEETIIEDMLIVWRKERLHHFEAVQLFGEFEPKENPLQEVW
jgi:hypothetical protein